MLSSFDFTYKIHVFPSWNACEIIWKVMLYCRRMAQCSNANRPFSGQKNRVLVTTNTSMQKSHRAATWCISQSRCRFSRPELPSRRTQSTPDWPGGLAKQAAAGFQNLKARISGLPNREGPSTDIHIALRISFGRQPFLSVKHSGFQHRRLRHFNYLV
jgi:hypothetical protein